MPETTTLFDGPQAASPEERALRALRPDDLSAAAPGWSGARAAIRDQVVSEPVPTTARRPLRLAVAAAAVLVAGGLGYGALHQSTVATPAGTSSPVATQAPATPLATTRTIPAGQYLVETTRITMTRNEAIYRGKTPGTMFKVTTVQTSWIDHTGQGVVKWHADRAYDSVGTSGSEPLATTGPVRDLSGMPTDPAGMRAWFLAHDKRTADSRSDDEIVWVAANDLFIRQETSQQLRAALVGMLRDNPHTTTTNVVLDGRRGVRVQHTYRTTGSDGGTSVDSFTLDSRTMALLASSSREVQSDGTLVIDVQETMTDPAHLASTHP